MLLGNCNLIRAKQKDEMTSAGAKLAWVEPEYWDRSRNCVKQVSAGGPSLRSPFVRGLEICTGLLKLFHARSTSA
jgi:hypothetical protein